jgi:cation diffusion facilitator family transporter
MSTARRTALASLVGALILAAAKITVGLATNSLGVLAEAVHSGVDAAAALITLYAVGVAERPPDVEHQYGHAKAQHLAALAESAVLGAVAVWIAVAAGVRLSSGQSPVEAPWYAFALMAGVLAVDAGRAIASYRVGRRLGSPALLANALHFASDFGGSLAVLIGLGLVALGVQGGDSVAAIVVAVIVLAAAGRLARVNIDVLMDRAPAGSARRVERAVRAVPGVSDVRSVRVRAAGGESFAEVVISVPRLQGVETSHQVMDRVEDAVVNELGKAQVAVHVEPAASDAEYPSDRVAAAAMRVPGVMEAHNITVLAEPEGQAVTLHVRLPADLTMGQARAIVARLKDEIHNEVGIARVYAHVEPSIPDPLPARDVGADEPALRERAERAVQAVAGECSDVVVYRQDGRLLVVTSLAGDPDVSVRDAHALASRIEDSVRAELDGVDDVIVEVT